MKELYAEVMEAIENWMGKTGFSIMFGIFSIVPLNNALGGQKSSL